MGTCTLPTTKKIGSEVATMIDKGVKDGEKRGGKYIIIKIQRFSSVSFVSFGANRKGEPDAPNTLCRTHTQSDSANKKK